MRRLLIIGALAFAGCSSPKPHTPDPDNWINEAPANARHIKFSTREGTRLSVDLSPDGSTIVFDLLGDLYTLGAAGGKATRVTSGMAVDAEPRFSPDGKSIAFISDRNGRDEIWLLDRATGALRRISDNPDVRYLFAPTWARDGRSIVVAARELSEFGTGPLRQFAVPDSGAARDTGKFITPKVGESLFISAAGRASVRTPPGLSFPGGPVFGPDGKLYLEYGQRSGNMHIPAGARAAIARLDLATGDTVTVIPAPGGGALRPAVSPDGKWLSYATRTDSTTVLMLHDLTSPGPDRLLVASYEHDVSDMADALSTLPSYAFTPDSKAIVASHHGKLWRINVADGAQLEIPFEADVDQAILPQLNDPAPVAGASGFASHVSDVAFSPDGGRVAFVAVGNIYVMSMTDKKPQRLTKNEMHEFAPAWSPDGATIAYGVVDTLAAANEPKAGVEGYVGGVFVAKADGSGEPVRMTTDLAFYDHPFFMPDGAIMARRSAHQWWSPGGPAKTLDTVPSLVRLGAQGQAPKAILKHRFAVMSGAIGFGRSQATGTPTRVYFLDSDSVGPSWGTKKWSVISVDKDGGDRRTELNIDLKDGYGDKPTAISVSPDGKQVVVLAADRPFIVPLDPAAPRKVFIGNGHPSDSSKVTELPTPAQDIGWTPDGKSVYSLRGRRLFLYDVASAKETEHELNVPLVLDRPTGTVVIKNATIIPIRTKETPDTVIARGDIVVTDDRITAMGESGKVTIPEGAYVIDGTGKFVMPGIVGLHEHVLGDISTRAQRSVWSNLPTQLAYGLTTLRDPSTNNAGNEYAARDLLLAGKMVGPRILSTGAVVGARLKIRNEADARFFARRQVLDETETMKEYDGHTRAEYRWVGQAAYDAKIRLTAHVGSGGYRITLGHIFDGYSGHEHELPPLLRYDMIRLIAESGIYVSSTMQFGPAECYGVRRYKADADPRRAVFIKPWITRLNLPACDTVMAHYTAGGAEKIWPRPKAMKDDLGIGWDERNLFWYAPDLAKIIRAGGRVGASSHTQIDGLGIHFEIWAMASQGGMTAYEALRSGTLVGAQALGIDKDVGSIEVGKVADLLVMDKNPLEDITNTLSLRQVVFNGRVYDSYTLNELAPRQREFKMADWNAWKNQKQ